MAKYSEAQMASLLRACIREQHGHPTPDDYDRWVVKGPTAAHIQERFGSWSSAIRLAEMGGHRPKTFAATAKAPLLTDFFRLTGDYMLTCDWHIPYHHPGMIERMMQIAKRFKIKRLAVIGDLLDIATFSKFDTRAEDTRVNEILATAEDVLALVFKWFERVDWCFGNHDTRLLTQVMDEIEPTRLARMMSNEVGRRLFVSKHPYMILNDKWRLTHPKSYSRISARTPWFLCAKYRMNVVNTHGHHFGLCVDMSGENVAYDLPCMTDGRKHPYLMYSDTTHPIWNLGFGMLKGETIYPFSDKIELTDWKFWLGKKRGA